MLRRHLILSSFVLLLSGLPAPVRAETPMFFSDGGSAINGYDTVAYFTSGTPVKGNSDITSMWKGVIWRFSSQANREAFEASPWAYAPQYGGYCAYGVSLGYRDTTEPDAWQIVDGKLYLIRTLFVRSVWKLDIGRHIASANANWPGVLSH